MIAIIEARMRSTRLPGKVLLQAAGKPLLAHLVSRLRLVPSIDQIVIATTINPSDDVLEQFASSQDVGCFRGSEADVMQRVYDAAVAFHADAIVDITADCPMLDPNVVEQVIQMFRINPCDYATNAHVRCFPDGMDVQVLKTNALAKSLSMTNDRLDREHVTLHIRNNPELFIQRHLPAPLECHWPQLGLTLDEPKDFELIKTLIEQLEPLFPQYTCSDIIRYLRANTHLLSINQSVIRKGDS